MANFRAFLFKYWIIIAVVLWVITWMSRDWLAGGVHPHGFDPQAALLQAAPVATQADPTEAPAAVVGDSALSATPMADSVPAVASQAPTPALEPVAVTQPPVTETVATATEPAATEPAVPMAAESVAEAGVDPTAVSATPATPEQAGDTGDTMATLAADTMVEVDAAETVHTETVDAVAIAASTPVPVTETPVAAAVSEADATDSAHHPVVIDAGHDTATEGESATQEGTQTPAEQAAPADETTHSTEIAEASAAAETAVVASEGENAAAILARARTAYSEGGARAAATVLSAGLRDLPQDAAGRADLYGQLGNFRMEARDTRGALSAFDQALQLLPAQERATMIQRLGPVYDQHHPGRRAYLEQFR